MRGIYSLPESEYRAADAVANSDLKLVKRSPAHFYAARLDPNREPEIDTPSKLMGRALHCAILEPWTFGQRFVFVPEGAPKDLRHLRNAAKPSQSTVDAIRWWDDFDAGRGSREIIDKRLAATVQRAGASIRSHPELAGYLNRPGTAEESIFATDPVTCVAVKIRPDWRVTIGGLRVMLDLKSTDDARPEAFARTAWNYGYFQGAAYYCDVHEWAGAGKVDLFLLAAFERDPPHAVKLYEVQEAELDRGRAMYRPALDLYAHCRSVNEWPAYSTDIEPLQFPSWAK